MNICVKEGNVIAVSDPPDSRIFDNMIIRNAFLARMELEGISFDGSDLQGSDFSGSDLYDAFLCDTVFDLCKMVDADLRSGFLFRASFRNADLRGAQLSLNNMAGALCLDEVDFSGANLDGANCIDAIYDLTTIFPDGFDPVIRGMKLK